MEWISVEDKLPMDGGDYLVTDGVSVTCSNYDRIYNEWLASSSVEPTYEMSNIRLLIKVKYWMPLPEAPKTD